MSVSEFDFYRENNRIEAKKASVWLPQSIWKAHSTLVNVLEVGFQVSFRFGRSQGGMNLKLSNCQIPPGLWFPFQCIVQKRESAINRDRKSSIVEYLESNGTCGAREMADYVGLKASRLRDYLGELVEDGIVVAEGSNRNRRYRLSDS